MSDRPLEPSDTERSEWPDAAREYVEWLEAQEDEIERLRQKVAELETRLVVPEGYVLERTGEDEITLLLPGGGGVFVRNNSGTLAEAAMYDLLNAIFTGSEEPQPDPTHQMPPEVAARAHAKYIVDKGWLICQGNEMPETLAPAQIVEVKKYSQYSHPAETHIVKKRADLARWAPGIHYRPALDADDNFMVSREGLEPETRYVATSESGVADQYLSKPARLSKAWYARSLAIPVPDTHRIPGDWRDSLASVCDEEG